MYRHRSRELSLLARGQGMLEGGIEVECFSNDSKAFSLTGKPLIQPAASHTRKPYKAHRLNLPKTFVTKRGQMVLFTAPEDMIIGKQCSFHEKEVVPQQAVSTLKTTSRLLDSALDYYPEDNFHQKHQQEEHEHSAPGREDLILTQPGHFTKVYLNSLQKASEAAQVPDGCVVEDIEEGNTLTDREGDLLAPCSSDAPPMSECDSGLGQSTISRLSAQSRLSDGRPVVIPHGSVDHGRELVYPDDEVESTSQITSGQDKDLLASLKNELAEQKTSSKLKKTSNKSGKKKQKLSPTNNGATANSTTSIKSKSKKCSSSEQKSGKSKRKRKKDARAAKHDCHSSGTELDQLMNENGTEQIPNGNRQLTAINLTPSDPVLSVTGQGNKRSGSEETLRRLAKAEERKREVERKRAEKRELEARKKRELEERLRLEEELAMAQSKAQSTYSLIQCQPDNISMTSVESDTSPDTPPTDPTPHQDGLRAELDRSMLSQHRWLLMSQGEKVEKELTEEMDAAQEAIRQARQAEEERRKLEELRLAEEKRRQEAEQQARLKEAARIKAAEILRDSSEKPSSDDKQRLDSDLSRQRQERLFSYPSSLMFSYYNYVPPPKPKRDKTRSRGAKAKTTKAQ